MVGLKIASTLCLIAVPPVLAGLCTLHRLDTSDGDLMTVLVATKDLASGTVVKEPEKFFVEKRVLRAAAPATAIREFKMAIYQKLRKPIAQGECITEDHLWTDADTEAAMTAMLRPGQVACTVSVHPDCLAGVIQSFERVDVVVVARQDDGTLDARTLLNGILLLAVIRDDSVLGRAKFMDLYTLAVTPEQAEQLGEAMRSGELRVALSK